jgi:hypothetical protein
LQAQNPTKYKSFEQLLFEGGKALDSYIKNPTESESAF